MKEMSFNNILKSNKLEFIMEAHNGISAKIAEKAGFKALWASSLTISASMGFRDSNELSWSQVLEIISYMSDSVSIPIMLDGDTGYGNFNNVRVLVKNLCKLGIAAVCIEDKIFPKTNSLINRNQDLANIEEFCGKIKAAKDTQTNPNFVVVARIEALIAGHTMEEALTRAHAYCEAGADAILIHSKKSIADEILIFAKLWNQKLPLIIVPTKYYKTPTELFRQNPIAAVIWANHSLRASVNAMQILCKELSKKESLIEIENKISSVEDIFELVNENELKNAESFYLPKVKE